MIHAILLAFICIVVLMSVILAFNMILKWDRLFEVTDQYLKKARRNFNARQNEKQNDHNKQVAHSTRTGLNKYPS